MTRIYNGWREPGAAGPGIVKVTGEWGVHGPLNARLDLANKSPTGFSWGYEGSGPAQLALALIADASGDDALALRTYQEFKRRLIAGLGPSWTLTQDEIIGLALAIDAPRAEAEKNGLL